MTTETYTLPASKSALWAGRIISLLPALLLMFAATMKLIKPAGFDKQFEQMGWPAHYATGLGILELSCAIVYLIPRTSVAGAILMTGFMGGAIATHIRLGQPPIIQALVPIMVWLGLYLRDSRIRALLPFTT